LTIFRPGRPKMSPIKRIRMRIPPKFDGNTLATISYGGCYGASKINAARAASKCG
jgi:hypothetical protein